MDQRSLPHLIVDGFNIAHAWPHIERLFANGLDAAIEALVQDLRVLHDSRPMRLTIVLDGKGSEIDAQRPYPEKTFSLVYSPASMTADGVIEQWVSVSKHPGRIIVASRDQMIVDSVEASGAKAISPEALLQWVDEAELRLKRKQSSRKNTDHTDWENKLPL